MNKTELFESNEKLIYKQSWHYAKKYNVDFEEVKSQAFLIFCEAIDRFEKEKASFTTYLFHRLRTLNDYCAFETKVHGNASCRGKGGSNLQYQYNSLSKSFYSLKEESNINLSHVGEVDIMDKIGKDTVDEQLERILFYQLVDLLSVDGKNLVQGLVSGVFHQPEMERQRPIGKHRVKEITAKQWGWTQSRSEEVWDEVKGWWNEVVN